jgi:hypothetical protein
MTQSVGILDLTVTATAAINGGSLVAYGGAPANTAGQKVMGVAVYTAAAGAMVPVRVLGTVPAVTGGAVNIGDNLACDVNGHVVTSTAPATDYVVGHALEAAPAAGYAIEILLGR